MSLSHKSHRYKTLLMEFKNWPQFLFFKLTGGNSFNFKMKNGFEIEVPKQMLPPFKESFFDGVYLRHFSREQLEKPEPVVVDIGGNVGFFSLFIFSKFPRAKVFTYEPMPFNFEQLKMYNQTYSKFDWTIENKLSEAINKAREVPAELSIRERQLVVDWLFLRFRHGDMAYFQYERRAIDESRLLSALKPLTDALEYQFARDFWERIQENFVPSYRANVNKYLANKDEPQSK